MQWQQFRQVVQNTEHKTALLWSQHHLEALASLFEAYQAAWSVKQLLQTAVLIDSLCGKPALTQHPQQEVTNNTQRIFAAPTSRDPCSGSGTLGRRDAATEMPYLFEKALFFDTKSLPPSPEGTPCAQHIDCCNLIMAAQCFNIGLCFHMQSRELLDEQLRRCCQQLALDFYNTVVEIVSEPSVVSMAISDPNSCSLLVVTFNNKAVICHENGEYEGCLNARRLLVLCLNAIASGGSSSKDSFLENRDVMELYSNGLLLLPPSIAGAA